MPACNGEGSDNARIDRLNAAGPRGIARAPEFGKPAFSRIPHRVWYSRKSWFAKFRRSGNSSGTRGVEPIDSGIVRSLSVASRHSRLAYGYSTPAPSFAVPAKSSLFGGKF